jgi:hypothetical protein
MSRSVNQHWVPQFYLREFATPATRRSKQPKVWIFSKNENDGNERMTNIRNICAKRYLYSPRGDLGRRDWTVDDKLQGVEDLLAQVWPAVARDFVDLSDEAIRKALALFVSTLYLRHPSNREVVRTIHSNLVNALETYPKRLDGSPAVDYLVHKGKKYQIDSADWSAFKNRDDDEHHLAFLDYLVSGAREIADILLTKRWSVIVSTKEHFVSSDKPVMLEHQERKEFGFGTPGAMITFPLSPTRILVMDDLHDEPCNQYYALVEKNVGAFNYGIWHTGTRFLITGRPVAQVLTEMVQWAENNGHA